jgi:hypothetical protein
MPTKQSGASALAQLLDGSTAGELILELVRHGLQQLIELEVGTPEKAKSKALQLFSTMRSR